MSKQTFLNAFGRWTCSVIIYYVKITNVLQNNVITLITSNIKILIFHFIFVVVLCSRCFRLDICFSNARIWNTRNTCRLVEGFFVSDEKALVDKEKKLSSTSRHWGLRSQLVGWFSCCGECITSVADTLIRLRPVLDLVLFDASEGAVLGATDFLSVVRIFGYFTSFIFSLLGTSQQSLCVCSWYRCRGKFRW